MPWLLTLSEIEGKEFALVGGKAFRLAMLKRYGFDVPPGLVLTTHFFETQIQFNRLTPLWAGSPDIAVTTESLVWLAAALKTKPLVKELREALNQQLDALFGPKIDNFAVRSSAIDEDQRDHTFAGVHLTELGVPRSALPISITRCWASALDEPALKYRQVHGMSIQAIRIAVLIQPMLSPRVSGVGFTINPLTGSRDELIIEATWGLGEAVVSGEIQPYFYKLANRPPDYPLLEERAGSVPPPFGEPPGVGPLTPNDLIALATQLEQIQALIGEPQDVEWGQYDDRSFFILQTRPVVAIPKPQVKTALDQEWTRGNYPKILPELPSPFATSLLERTQNRATEFFQEVDLHVEEVGSFVKLILGRPYLNLTLLKRAVTQMGLKPDVLYITGYTDIRAGETAFTIDQEAAWYSRYTYWQGLKRMFNADHHLQAYQDLAAELITTLEQDNPADLSPATLLIHLRRHEQLYEEFFKTELRLTMGIAISLAIAGTLLTPLTESPATLVSDMALKGVKTTEWELNETFLELGQLARKSQTLQQYLMAADFHDYPQALAAPENQSFRAAFDRFLAQYGYRAAYELDPGWPRYQDDPTALFWIIRQHAQIEPQAHPKSEQTPLSPWRRWLTTPFINNLHRLLAMRETLDTAHAKAVAACRAWDLALGQCWVKQGWLAEPGDFFWLTLDDVERTLMVKGEVGVTLSATVRARKATYETYAETSMPFTVRESEIPSIQVGVGLRAGSQPEVLVGLPVSPGQAHGTALVLRSPDEFEPIAAEIILVMPSTGPAWLPLLHRAAGLVVETGGLLSHGSVIAREYGLPAVANIPHATQLFQTGDTILVDGSTGVVQLLERKADTRPII
jgi:pyruvate,water dikinase